MQLHNKYDIMGDHYDVMVQKIFHSSKVYVL